MSLITGEYEPVYLTKKLQLYPHPTREPLVCYLQITGERNRTKKGEVRTCTRGVKMVQAEVLDHRGLSI